MSQLEFGTFYGEVKDRYACDGLLMSELRHHCARKLPEHAHKSAYFSMLMGGSYREEAQGRKIEVPWFSTVYHPAGVPHRDEVGNDGGWFFTVELDQAWLAECLPHSWDRMETRMVEGPPLALRLYFAYKSGTLSPLEAETLVLELMGAASGEDFRGEAALPRWLRTCLETIHDDPAFPHTVKSLASQAGVHPVHLARVFRHRHGYSLSDYVQSLRLRMALRALENPELRIADIACDTGFADQSHLSRIVRHWTGVPPGAFRRFLRSAQETRAADSAVTRH